MGNLDTPGFTLGWIPQSVKLGVKKSARRPNEFVTANSLDLVEGAIARRGAAGTHAAKHGDVRLGFSGLKRSGAEKDRGRRLANALRLLRR